MPKLLASGHAHAAAKPPSFRIWRSFVAYGVACILSILLMAWAFRLWRADLAIPFCYEGDAVLYQMLTKTLAENDWVLHNDRLGAPAGLDMHDFPFSDSLHFFFLQILARLTDSVPVAINLYYLALFPLTTLISLFVMRRLGLSYGVSVVLALLYAFLPYRLLRSEHHLCLVAYYLVPLMVWVSLRIYRGENLLVKSGPHGTTGRGLSIWRMAGLVLFGLIFASAGAYYAFFACWFLAVAGTAAAVGRRAWYPLRNVVLLAGALAVGVGLNVLPMFLYRLDHGRNGAAVVRYAVGADILALRLNQLLLPVPGHRVSALARLTEKCNSGLPCYVNENAASTLGAIGAVGLILMLARLLFRRERFSALSLWDGLSILTVFALLLATSGGLGPLLSYQGLAWIRGYNRISVYVAFFALVAVGLALDPLAGRYVQSARARLAWIVALSAMLIGGFLDLVPRRSEPDYVAVRERFERDAAFVAEIESAMPQGALVAQLPYLAFVESLPAARMQLYDHGRAYLHSRSLRWTYGAMQGRECDRWQRAVLAKPPEEMVRELAAAGFSGIYVDRFGYADGGVELEAGLRRTLGGPCLVSSDGRFAFYAMTGS
jgi:phosphoglycerol transferase